MKGYIYKLCCKDLTITDIYIGSTRNFTRRKARHKSCCNNENIKEYNSNVYQFIRANNGWNNWDMVLVEKGEFEETIDLHKRERYWIETLGANLNTSIPTRTQKELYQIQKEDKKKYYLDNRERIFERINRNVVCEDCNKEMKNTNMSYHTKKLCRGNHNEGCNDIKKYML
jgi:hypothetical protein